VQRIVTEVDAEGVSRVVPARAPLQYRSEAGFEVTEVWVNQTLPPDLTAPGDVSTYRREPPPGGAAFRIVSVPPDVEGLGRLQALARESGTIHPWLEPDQYGMHRTQSIDYATVIAGEVWLRLDGGEEVLLHPGDCVVQRATMHAWRNKSNAPCLIAFVLVSADSA
jgi:hypothetical protein